MRIYVYGAIPYIHRTQKYYASVAAVALKPSFWQHNFAGLDMSSAWRTTGYPNRSSSDSCRQANAHSVVLIPTEWKLFGPMSVLLSINN